jgi:hypothetical protein
MMADNIADREHMQQMMAGQAEIRTDQARMEADRERTMVKLYIHQERTMTHLGKTDIDPDPRLMPSA